MWVIIFLLAAKATNPGAVFNSKKQWLGYAEKQSSEMKIFVFIVGTWASTMPRLGLEPL